jgi:predicted acylesterase/phospholipase RssA
MTPRRLRADLPFQRIALVLSGGGALGAYEVGVLKVLEAVALAPAIVAGVSIGAMNAVVWLAHGRHTGPLERTWRGMKPAHIGLHWVALVLRAAGAFGAVVALLEVLLGVMGSRELSGSYWIWKKASARVDLWSAQLDITSWILLAVLCLLLAFFARQVEGWLVNGQADADPARGRRMLGRATLVAALAHAVVWVMGWAWPHRFSASIVILLLLAWLGSGTGWVARALQRGGFGLVPETRGRGLWNGKARMRLVRRLVAEGDATLLTGAGTRLVVSALALDSGRVTHFTSWPDPSREFRTRLDAELGEVVPLRDADELIRAAVASSAIPGVFEPERLAGREFVDAGGFSNQPLHVALAAEADAVMVVLLSPSQCPTVAPQTGDMFSLVGRLLEFANWRDLQTELRSLPAGWDREGDPARVCVIEPDRALPGTVLGFDPGQAAGLIALGERDAWQALERAGWLAVAGADQ